MFHHRQEYWYLFRGVNNKYYVEWNYEKEQGANTSVGSLL